MHSMAAQLVGPAMRAYLYRTADPKVTFLECPFKGLPYESMLARARDTVPGAELFRTFEKDRWNYYRWRDYATHPRWTLPYRADERHRAEPGASGNSRAAVLLMPYGKSNIVFAVGVQLAAVPELAR